MTPADSPSRPSTEPAVGPEDAAAWRRLDDPEAARVLADAAVRAFLAPFVWRERRATDVAAELGVTRNAVLYRARQFLRLGLLEVTREEARAGRAVKFYRATSRGFFVPFTATPAATVAALYELTLGNPHRDVDERLTRAWAALAEDPRWFGLYTYGDEGGLRSHRVLPFPPADPRAGEGAFAAWLASDAGPVLVDNTFSLRLRRDDAKAFQRDLDALQRRYQALRADDGDPYVVRLALAPD